MAEPGTFERIMAEVGQALLPLRDALASPEACFGLLLKLGWHSEDIPPVLVDLGSGVDTLYTELRKVLGDGGLNVGGSVSVDDGAVSGGFSADSAARLLDAVQKVVKAIEAISSAPAAAIPAALRADGFATKFPKQLFDYLVVTYLQRRQPALGFALRALGVVKTRYVPVSGGRPPHLELSLDFSDLPRLFDDPSIVLKNAYGWGTDDFDYEELLSQIDNLLGRIDIRVVDEIVPLGQAKAITGAATVAGDPPSRALRAVFFERVKPTTRLAAEVKLLPLPKVGGDKPGMAVVPSFSGLLSFKFDLGANLSVTIRSDLNLQGGVALKLRPDKGIEIITGFADSDTASTAKGSAEVVAETSNGGEPILLLGGKDSTRLQFRRLGGRGGVRLEGGKDPDVYAEFELKGLEFVFAPGDGDGFIAKIVPKDGFKFGTDLTLGLSHRQGFYFRGTSHLEIQVPAHQQLGPIEIQSLTISASPSGSGIPIGLGATFKAALGPLQAVVEQIGITAAFTFPSNRDGNLGPLDVALKFRPPKGVGLSVDAGIVKGGGYLFIDAEKGEYAGALELSFANIVSVKAIGLINTKMPDGSKGFSLLIIISAEFGSGIQLGFGFVLLGVGGLLGLNRTMNLDALANGVRTGTLTSVMFPENIIANAPKIISDLRLFFPPKEGTFLIGPMAKLGWGTPALVTVSLGIIIEIPGNIAILGVLRVALPTQEAAIILLQVQFLGAIEFDKKRLWFFASLFDSRVVFLTLDGELGLLVAWGGDANFVLSVGGFHPRFSAPPLPFPSPRRIEISLLSSSVCRVSVQGYFAVTSNTVQFGARVDVYFGLSALNVKGHLAFDALFQFSPFWFIIEISASLSVNVFGAGLFSVGIRGQLSGPTPWHIKGHGEISLLFWDIDVEFEKTWGDKRDTQLPPVPVRPMLVAELDKPETWKALAPVGDDAMVTLRKLPETEAAQVLHPIGVLHLSQRKLPLGITLDKVGNQKPSDFKRLDISVATSGMEKKADAFEKFAPAQFREHKDAEKLSAPAFADERSGLDLSAAGSVMRTSGMTARIVRYEEIIIDNNFKRFARRFRVFITGLFTFFLGGAAVTRCELSKAAKDKLSPFTDKVELFNDSYVVASSATNQPVATFTSKASAQDYLAAADPELAETLHVIPGFEAVGV